MLFNLRPWHMDDLDNLVKYANNEAIAKFMTNQFPHPYAIENGKKFIEFATKDNPVHIFAIDISKKMQNSDTGWQSPFGAMESLQRQLAKWLILDLQPTISTVYLPGHLEPILHHKKCLKKPALF
jgi:hypothetical protein